MLAFLQKTSFLFIIVLMAIATSGITFFTRYCHHHHMNEASIVVDLDECKENKACCSTENHGEEAPANHDCNHCGQLQATFLRTDLFQLADRPILKIQVTHLFQNTPAYSLSIIESLLRMLGFDEPYIPPEYGKCFLITHHQLKIAPADFS